MGDIMEVKLQKWGNSYGVRIPKSLLDSLGLKENDLIKLEQEDNKITMVKKKNSLSLKERFNNYEGENLSKDFEWDDPKGKEIW